MTIPPIPHRWLGALLLLLALPGLFLPGGLDFSLCVCGTFDCASEVERASAPRDCCVRDCCEAALDDQRGPQLTHALDDCGCCLSFHTRPTEDSTPAKAALETPSAALPLHALASTPFSFDVTPRASFVLRATSPAPPAPLRSLPLRI